MLAPTEAIIQYMGFMMYSECQREYFIKNSKKLFIQFLENMEEKQGLVVANPATTDLYINRQFIVLENGTVTESKDVFAVHDQFGNELFTGPAFEVIHYVDEFLLVS